MQNFPFIYTKYKRNSYHNNQNHQTNSYNTFNYNNYNNIICINCEESGHTFKFCKKPITSYGILAINSKNEILLVQRSYTIGYIDFIRGKYTDLNNAKILLQEMTKDEHFKILNYSFDEIWNSLWVSKTSKIYRTEYKYAKETFEKLDIIFIMYNTPTKYIQTEHDFPKGRRNNAEGLKQCAVREFMEETYYSRNEFELLETEPLEETFIGSNGIWYKHVYFFAKMKTERIPEFTEAQMIETKRVVWLNFKDAINRFRLYDKSKRTTIYKAYKMIKMDYFKN